MQKWHYHYEKNKDEGLGHMNRMCFAIAVLLSLAVYHTAAQGIPSDTDAFINHHFLLQDSYRRVLCVSGDALCPAEVTTTVPCLTLTCAHTPQTYTVADTFTTIQDAADNAQPGDLIIILPGHYRGVQVEGRGGEDGAYIHFLGWGEPGSIIVDEVASPDSEWLRDLFYFIDSHHIIIQNLAFEGAERAGIFSSGYFSDTGHFSHHFIVMDVYSHDNGVWGLHTTSTSIMLIQDSTFTGSAEEHGAYISGSGDHVVIRRNVFQGNTASGLQVNADPQTATEEVWYWLSNSTDNTCDIAEDDIWSTEWEDVKACYDSQGLPDLGEYFEDGISQDLIIEQNVITGNGASGGAGINLASVRESVVRNNLIYGNGAAGIACWDNGYTEEKELESSQFGCQRVQISNNTLVDETGGRGALILNQDARDLVVANNIILRDRFDAYEITGRSGQGLTSVANAYFAQVVDESPGTVLIDSDATSGSVTGFSVQDGLANFVAPGFAPWVLLDDPWPVLNPDRPDYHLRSDSPWTTIANPSYSSISDLAGLPRTGSELGAYGTSPEAKAALLQMVPGGWITYRLPEGHIYRLAAAEGAEPQDISSALDALAPAATDEWLNISPDGAWLLLSTERFDPACNGWACLVLVDAGLTSYEVVRVGSDVIHPSGFSAIGPDVIVYPSASEAHATDLWALKRVDGLWIGPTLLTSDSPYNWNSLPAISADGSRILFDCGNEPYGGTGTAICEVNIDGSEFLVRFDAGDGVALHHADYAPEGIVFESNWEGNERIWYAEPESELVLVLGDFGNDNSPCVLSDGRVVSLWLGRPGNDPGYHEIKVMSSEGSASFMALTDVDVLDGGLGCGG
jgi:hypothetical protein